MTKMERDIDSVCQLVDQLCAPKRMNLEEASDFLEGVIAELDARLEGVRVTIKRNWKVT